MRLMPPCVVLAAITVLACQQQASTSFTPQDEAAIRAINDSATSYINAGAWDKWANLYTDDGAIHPPNARPVVGRAALEQFGRSMPPMESANFFDVHINGSGDLAYLTSGIVMKPRGQPADTGKQLVVLRRTNAGWRAAAVSFNSDRVPAAPAPSAPPATKKS